MKDDAADFAYARAEVSRIRVFIRDSRKPRIAA